MHVDASLIRADVSWESLAVRHVEAVASANGDELPDPEEERRRRNSRQTGKFKKVCLTDPDATHGDERPQPSARAELQAARRRR